MAFWVIGWRPWGRPNTSAEPKIKLNNYVNNYVTWTHYLLHNPPLVVGSMLQGFGLLEITR